MDTILVVNAGSSSVKFQVFGADGKADPGCLIKGQVDGIGTRPRLRAESPSRGKLIDESYASERITDVPAALLTAGSWLRGAHRIDPIAVGDIQALVRHLTNRGIGVLITDHNVRETLGLTDRAYIVYAGEILIEGNPDEIVNDPDVRRLYLGEEFRL